MWSSTLEAVSDDESQLWGSSSHRITESHSLFELRLSLASAMKCDLHRIARWDMPVELVPER